MTRVETMGYFDTYCRQEGDLLLIIFYIIYSYKMARLVWFADKNVEREYGLVGYFQFYVAKLIS